MIKIVKHDNEHIHCYTVWVISNNKGIPISVDTGVKPFQLNAGVNVPATGELHAGFANELIKGINIANDLAYMTVNVTSDPNWTFKPISR